MSVIDVVYGIVAAVAGAFIGNLLLAKNGFDEAARKAKAEKMVTDAQHEARTMLKNAHEKAEEMKKNAETSARETEEQLKNMEKMFEMKQATLTKREVRNKGIQEVIEGEEKTVQHLRSQQAGLQDEIKTRLTRTSGLSADRVKEEILSYYENEFVNDRELRVQHAAEWAAESAVRDGRAILADVMHRFSDITSVEHGDGTITVQHDEVKGRLVGRGGHTIALFEKLFEVDVIFNDEPNTIIVSCFNLVQQEIAKKALERLMREKIINEEIILRAKKMAEQDVDKILQKYGETALKALELTNMAPEFTKLVGRLAFRTSYGQNIMRHCFEVGYFARLLAGEIGADTHVAFLGGFFHDIGKAIDQVVGGSHDVLSKEILEKYGFSWEITHAAWTHHNAIPQETVEARIVQAADAISASRPGARAESVERYLAKIKELEATALSFPGVKKAYAINAGREVRVVLDGEKVTDKQTMDTATGIAQKVQEKGGYPGKIKVMTIRTTKVTNYAR